VVPREDLAAAIAALSELPPALDFGADEAWRAMLVLDVDCAAPPRGLARAEGAADFLALMGRKNVGPAETGTFLLIRSW
jgi:hypothetical protein